MRIKDKKHMFSYDLAQIEPGCVFKHNDKYYMKLKDKPENNTFKLRGVNLSNGEVMLFVVQYGNPIYNAQFVPLYQDAVLYLEDDA